MLNSLESQISALYASAHELLYLGVDGSPIYSDHFNRLNREVFRQANSSVMALLPRRKPLFVCPC